jgi:hypothetical protein
MTPPSIGTPAPPVQVEVRPIPGFPNYRVRSDGVVESYRRIRGSREGQRAWVPLKPCPTGPRREYGMVLLYAGGRGVPRKVHEIILTVFRGPRPDRMVCRHLDGDPRNNRLENLAWGTTSENHLDKRRHGTDNRGERHNLVKLTEAAVREIRRRYALLRAGKGKVANGLLGLLAAEYGVNVPAIYRAATGRQWKHVP